MASFDFNNLFNLYYTTEGIPFTLKNRAVAFPEDISNPIYGIKYVAENTPWTILSYNLYGTINYWWILCNLNQSQIFYAEEGAEIKYILPEYIEDVIATISQEADG